MKDSFHFLREVTDNTYVECYGVDFEDFEIGQIFEHRPGRTFTWADCQGHAQQALDLSPRYSDAVYSTAVYGDRQQIPETAAFAFMAVTTRTFGKVVANLEVTNCTTRPVYVGDTLYFESEILGKRESGSRPEQGILQLRSTAKNQTGEQVIDYERKLLLYRRGAGHYASVGY